MFNSKNTWYTFCSFSELIIFRNLLHIISQVLELSLFFVLFCFSVPYFGLACDHGNSFLCLE